MHGDERRQNGSVSERCEKMTFYYSVKQIFRSPVKSILFLLLMGLCACALALGASFWYMGNDELQGFDEAYITVGTVEQKYEGTKTNSVWDPESGTYQYYSSGYFGEWIRDEALDFEGADYIIKPRQRPYFGAYIENLYDGIGSPNMGTVEATPVETGSLYPSLLMQVVRVIDGTMEEGERFYLCDHQSMESDILEAGKTYVMQIQMMTFAHGPAVGDGEQVIEYWFAPGILSSQYTMDGEKLYDPVNETGRYYDEVTDGFYETERGKRWLKLASWQDLSMRTIPVQPVDETYLLMYFYNGEAKITEGRDITKKEYEEGAKVCLIPESLSRQIGVKLGDMLKLPLYFADYSRSAGDAAPLGGGGLSLYQILNADGEIYDVFCEQDYEVVGIYNAEDKGSGSYGAGNQEVVIPWNAVPENCWEDNITGFYPMTGATTSFQIANGTIEEFQEKWNTLGLDELELRFYDMGYTQMQDQLENRRLMSVVFIISGCVTAVMILCFFSGIFITGQRERIAAERLLGRTKRQCAVSVLTGTLLLCAAGCAVGSVSGWLASRYVAEKTGDALEFDRMFSDDAVADAEPAEQEQPPGPVLPCVTGSVLLVAATVISSIYMGKSLKKEPLEMLGEGED